MEGSRNVDAYKIELESPNTRAPPTQKAGR